MDGLSWGTRIYLGVMNMYSVYILIVIFDFIVVYKDQNLLNRNSIL